MLTFLLCAKILLTLSTLGYSAIPVIFDSNSTHMTNPLWVGHARFHVVWQVSTYVCVAALALYLIWSPGDGTPHHLWYAAFLSIAAYAGFFAAVFAVRLYGGATYDPNGVVPYRPPFLGRYLAFEVNITLFSGAVAILVMGIMCIVMAHSTHISPGLASLIWSLMAALTAVLTLLITVFVLAFLRRGEHSKLAMPDATNEVGPKSDSPLLRMGAHGD